MTSQPDHHRPDPADDASPALRSQVLGLRDSMAAAAAAIPLPARFGSEPHGSQVTITDRGTGRAVTIGLCDYHGARKTLAALFPAPQPAAPPFRLDDRAHLADLTEVDQYDDRSAATAITDAAAGPAPLITSAGGAGIAAELVADGDGDIDGYRILVRLPGRDHWLASGDILHAGDYDAADVTVAVLAGAVATANQMAAWDENAPWSLEAAR